MGFEKAYISAGTNLGERKANLEFAVSALAQRSAVTRVSSFFETEPVGFADQQWFLNMALEIETNFSARELLNVCKEIEQSCGRIRTFPNAPRTLDLDILFYADSVIREDDLIIPHPRLAERRFVLEPLAEIAPDLMHPLLGRSVQTLLEICPDVSRVFKKNGGG